MEENDYTLIIEDFESYLAKRKDDEFPPLDIIRKLPPEHAVIILNDYIKFHPQDDEAYTIRGLKFWSINLRKEAINDYHTALRINPDSQAKSALELANSVLDFFNKDLWNP